jgi:hypothetical protein
MKISPTTKRLWVLLLAVSVAYQVVMLLRLRAQHVQFFRSTQEMLLVVALVAVLFVGILVKSNKRD